MEKIKPDRSITRRHFLNSLGFGTAGLVVLGSYGFSIRRDLATGKIKAIAVNFEKCAGCRTCEAVCSSYNNMEIYNGKKINGKGNPSLSNIRVYHYNPDIDIPSTCALCSDSPCVEACPVDPDPVTGHKALYRDEELMIIVNDLDRCIGCRSCAEACRDKRAGVIHSNPETGSPEHMCTLCGGEPQCVKYCPYDALSYIEMDDGRDLSGLSPDRIAERMIEKLYNLKVTEG
jgi:anaerobic carbon-monoxide dehydrogenase iron sulfur subunit